MRPVLFLYLAAANLFGFALCAYDKHAAVRHRWRVRESTLLLCAAFGGSVGMWLAMEVFHHKTRHLRFALGVPVMLAVQAGILIYLLFANVI